MKCPRCVTTSGQLCLEGLRTSSAAVMADSSPVKDFLSTINLGQHRNALKTAGYDDVEDYSQMGAATSWRRHVAHRRCEDERYGPHLGGDTNTSGQT